MVSFNTGMSHSPRLRAAQHFLARHNVLIHGSQCTHVVPAAANVHVLRVLCVMRLSFSCCHHVQSTIERAKMVHRAQWYSTWSRQYNVSVSSSFLLSMASSYTACILHATLPQRILARSRRGGYRYSWKTRGMNSQERGDLHLPWVSSFWRLLCRRRACEVRLCAFAAHSTECAHREHVWDDGDLVRGFFPSSAENDGGTAGLALQED